MVAVAAWREVLYGFLFRDGLQIHLCRVAEVDERSNPSEILPYVDNAPAPMIAVLIRRRRRSSSNRSTPSMVVRGHMDP